MRSIAGRSGLNRLSRMLLNIMRTFEYKLVYDSREYVRMDFMLGSKWWPSKRRSVGENWIVVQRPTHVNKVVLQL